MKSCILSCHGKILGACLELYNTRIVSLVQIHPLALHLSQVISSIMEAL
jgi:hypothetical protein